MALQIERPLREDLAFFRAAPKLPCFAIPAQNVPAPHQAVVAAQERNMQQEGQNIERVGQEVVEFVVPADKLCYLLTKRNKVFKTYEISL